MFDKVIKMYVLAKVYRIHFNYVVISSLESEEIVIDGLQEDDLD